MSDASLLKLRGYVLSEVDGAYINTNDKKIFSTMYISSMNDSIVKGNLEEPTGTEWKAYYLTPVTKEEINSIAFRFLTSTPKDPEIVKEEPVTNPKDLVGVKKPSLELVPPCFEVEVSRAMKDGGEKYGPYNWRDHPVKATVYYAACKRHLAAWADGEDVDPKSKVKHVAHAAACLAILLDAENTQCLIDDRSKSYTVGNIIRKYTEE